MWLFLAFLLRSRNESLTSRTQLRQKDIPASGLHPWSPWPLLSPFFTSLILHHFFRKHPSLPQDRPSLPHSCALVCPLLVSTSSSPLPQKDFGPGQFMGHWLLIEFCLWLRKSTLVQSVAARVVGSQKQVPGMQRSTSDHFFKRRPQARQTVFRRSLSCLGPYQ